MIDKIRANLQDFLQGKTKVIPCTLDRFNNEYAGIRKGDYICFTGSTSSGKTTLTKKIAVWDAIEYAIENNLDLKILYFGLEESEEEFEYSMLSYLLKVKFGLRYNILDFEYVYNSIKDDDFDKIDKVSSTFKLWRTYIQYYDNIYHPYAIYSKVKEFAQSRGEFIITDATHTNWDKYIPNNPEEFIIVIVDHISLVIPEKSHNNQLDLAMQSMSTYLRQYVSKKFKYTAISVHQQMAASEDLDHVKEKAWMPTLNGLADNKRIGRDYLTVIGIGNPKRYGISTFGGYNQLPDYNGFLRFLVIRKQRYGITDSYIGITMDGKTGTIKAAPPPNENELLKRLKEHIQTL